MKQYGYRKFYLFTLAALLLVSAYPLIHGARMIYLTLANGAIEPAQYAKYVVPYTAMCAAVLLFAAAVPLLNRLGRAGFPAGLAGAYAVFFPIERYLETLQIRTDGLHLVSTTQMIAPDGVPATVDIWQAALCIASPLVRGEASTFVSYAPGERYYFYVMEGSGYKIHYYFIALLLITMVCGLVYSALRVARAGDREAERPVILRFLATALLSALCVFANTTAFFRQTAEIQTPLASVLTALFFVVLGCAAGVYLGSFLLKRGKVLGLTAPAALAMAAVGLMYFGEAAMMGGGLYRFGTGAFFAPFLPGLALAPVDIFIIALAGLAAWGVLLAARRGGRWPGRRTAVAFGALCLALGLCGAGISAAQERAAASPVFGSYAYGECVYINPLSSRAVLTGGPERFEITEDALIVSNTNDDSPARHYIARYENTPVPPDEFAGKVTMGLDWPITDLSGYKQRWLRAVFTSDGNDGRQYGLYSMDGELWLAELTDRAGLWSVCKLQRLDL